MTFRYSRYYNVTSPQHQALLIGADDNPNVGDTGEKQEKKKKKRRRQGIAMAICIATLILIGWVVAVALQALSNTRGCHPNPCFNNGTCTKPTFSAVFTCTCPPGVFGILCETDTCNPSPCINGGVCANGTCLCPVDYGGVLCEIAPVTTTTTPVTTTVINTTTTDTTTTTTDTTTTDTTTTDTTTTDTTTTGTSCPDPCMVNMCLNGGTCMDGGCVPYCNCTIYYTGTICEIPVVTTMSGIILDESGSHLRIDVNHATIVNPNYTYYQLFTLFRPNETTTYYASETPSPTSIPVFAFLTSVIFPIGPANGDIITSYLYDGPDANTATLISSTASLQYRTVPSILIGYDTQLAWNGTDYAYYPLQIGGLNGTVVENMTAYMDYARTTYYMPYPTTDAGTGLLHGLSTVIDLPITTPERVGRPDKYFIYKVIMTGLGNVNQLPYSASSWNYVLPLIYNNENVILGDFDHNTDVDWGDGSPIQVFGSGYSDVFGAAFLNYMGSSVAHNYASSGTYIIRLAGRSRHFSERSWNRISSITASRISDVLQWGDYVTQSLDLKNAGFFSAPPTATDSPSSSITTLAYLFFGVPTWNFNPAGWIFPLAEDVRHAFTNRAITSSVAGMFPGTGLQLTFSMFQFATFTFSGQVGVEAWYLNGLIDNGMFFQSTLSASNFVSLQSGITNAASMFNSATIGDFSTITLTNVDQDLTSIIGLFQDCVFTLPPDMTALTFPSAVSASGAFSGINNLGALPNLNLISATIINDLFSFSTWPTTAPSSSAWTFPNVVLADRMFTGAGGAAFALDASGWGFAQLQLADSMFEQTTGITVLDVSSWTPSGLSKIYHIWTESSILTVNIGAWGMTPLETDEGFIRTTTNVVGIDTLNFGAVESAAYMFNLYTGSVLNVAAYNTAALITATGMFYQYIGGPCAVTNWNVVLVIFANEMFRESNCLPSTGLWSPLSLVTVTDMVSECLITPSDYDSALIIAHNCNEFNGQYINPRQNAITSVNPVSPVAVLQTCTGAPIVVTYRSVLQMTRGWTLVDVAC